MSEVLLQTTLGDIRLELFESTMPVTAGNFRKLVEKGFYNGVAFHRVIPKFMIQGGDPTGTGRGGPGYTIKDEFTRDNRNARGTISMANAGPDTGGSQFFINVVDNVRLDPKHPVFGKVVAGLEVADAISRVARNRDDRPLTDVVIKRATVVKE
jgi:cyclophilin family peptidyl-prolyl cis-trans isomerase